MTFLRAILVLFVFSLFLFFAYIFYGIAFTKSEMKRVNFSLQSTVAASPTQEIEKTTIPTSVPIVQQARQPVTISEGELIAAINNYRQSHGFSVLAINQSLCNETRKRVQDMVALNAGKDPANIILNHDGMAQDVQNGVLSRAVGKRSYGENIASAYCRRPSDGVVIDVTTGVQLVEWCFDSSEGHRENLLRPDWTDVCSSGQFPFYVETFAK